MGWSVLFHFTSQPSPWAETKKTPGHSLTTHMAAAINNWNKQQHHCQRSHWGRLCTGSNPYKLPKSCLDIDSKRGKMDQPQFKPQDPNGSMCKLMRVDDSEHLSFHHVTSCTGCLRPIMTYFSKWQFLSKSHHLLHCKFHDHNFRVISPTKKSQMDPNGWSNDPKSWKWSQLWGAKPLMPEIAVSLATDETWRNTYLLIWIIQCPLFAGHEPGVMCTNTCRLPWSVLNDLSPGNEILLLHIGIANAACCENVGPGGLSAFRHIFGPTCASIWGKIRMPHQRSYRDWRRWKHKRCLSELQLRFDTFFPWHQKPQCRNRIDLHQAISICQTKSLKASSLASCPIQLWLMH